MNDPLTGIIPDLSTKAISDIGHALKTPMELAKMVAGGGGMLSILLTCSDNLIFNVAHLLTIESERGDQPDDMLFAALFIVATTRGGVHPTKSAHEQFALIAGKPYERARAEFLPHSEITVFRQGEEKGAASKPAAQV